MAWYEIQIIGVITGGLLVFLTNFIDRILERRKEKKRLIAGIKTEMKVHTGFLEDGLKELEGYRNELEKPGTLKRKFKFIGGFERHFLDRNLDKIGILDESLIEKLVEYCGLLDATNNATKIIEETLLKSKFSGAFDNRQISITINSYNKMITLGKEIIKLS